MTLKGPQQQELKKLPLCFSSSTQLIFSNYKMFLKVKVGSGFGFINAFQFLKVKQQPRARCLCTYKLKIAFPIKKWIVAFDFVKRSRFKLGIFPFANR